MASIGPRMPPLATPLTLHTLGGASLRMISGAEVLGPGKPLALLVYLACDPRGTASRTHLLDLLWSDTEPERARHALRQAIWYVRQLLGPDVLKTSNADLILDARISVDRDRLLGAVSRGQCEEAIDLYTGEFLHKFAVPGGAGFEHWADVERQRLRAAFQRFAERTVRRWIDAGRFRDAQALARRSRDTAPADESVWRLVLETLHATGDQLGIAMESAALLKELAEDGRTPEPATRALLASISRQVDANGDSSSNPLFAELVGREQQFAHCVASWNRVTRARTGQHLHILAPAGYGKSRLMHDVRVRLHSLGARCVTVRATPGQRDIAYSCASDLVAALASLPGAAAVSPATATILVALNPSLSSRYPMATGGPATDDPLHRRSSAVAELCSVVAEEGPFALLLDDLHWVDNSSRQIIRTLLERVEQYPCLSLTSGRPGSDHLTFGDSTQVISLPPLSVENISRLLSSLGSLPDEPWARELPTLLCQSTQGSPLLVLESLRLTLDRGDLRLQQGEWSCVRSSDLRAHLTEGRTLRHRHDQLTLSERETLLLLSSAGEGVPSSLLSHAMQLAEAVILERLGILEQKGFVQRSGDRWQALHDEIARESLLAATPEEQRRSHTMLGGALSAGAARRGDYIRAARHLFLADRRGELRDVAIGYVRLLRREGDNRRVRYLIHDLLPDADAPTLERLLDSLGRWNRLRYTPLRPVLIGGGTIAALLVASAALRTPPETSPPDVELLVAPEDSATPAFQVPVRTAEFFAADRLAVMEGERPRFRVPAVMAAPTFTADGHCVYYTRTTSPENTTDVLRQCDWGQVEQIHADPRDDGFPAPSPDGRRVAFITSRWSPVGADNYDLAIKDLRTGEIIQVVATTSAMEARAIWSPDGTRIAFIQRRGNDHRVCLVPPLEHGPVRCHQETRGIAEIAGWITPDQLLLGFPVANGNAAVRFTISTGRLDTLARATTSHPLLSQDGRWFTAMLLPRGHSRPRWYLFRTESPGDPRPLDVSGEAETVRVFPLSSRVERRSIDSLAIGVPRAALPLGIAYQLKLTATNPAGEELALEHAAGWSVAPADAAIIDSNGILTPLRGDSAVVTAAFPGWRTATRLVRLRNAPTELLLDERWSEPLAANWVAYGNPRPLIVQGPGRVRAFLNNGDGSYPSGAYRRTGWELTSGLAVEARISAPINRLQWQTIAIELCGGCDSSANGAWDHTNGPPGYEGTRKLIRSCGMAYPGGEGPGTDRLLGFVARATPDTVTDVTGRLGTGEWHTLLLQLFPDGRCGLAVDGRGLKVTQVAVTMDRPFHLVLTGNSANTRMLVGPLTVWRGIREGVDWAHADR